MSKYPKIFFEGDFMFNVTSKFTPKYEPKHWAMSPETNGKEKRSDTYYET